MPEAWLRSLWHQRHLQSPLRTTDGRPVEIHRTGIPNGDAGPDFLDARIRIGNTTYRGDVEIHVHAADWETHRHGSDPHYNRVVLHVALAPPRRPARTASGRPIPLLLLPPPHEFPRHLPTTPLPSLRCAGMAHPSPAALLHHLRRFGFLRMARKVEGAAGRFEQLLAETGTNGNDPRPWEQLIYEGVLEGLGYAKNRGPFLALARNVPVRLLRNYDLTDEETMRAILFGAAGLLRAVEESGELRSLRSRWQELRPRLQIPILHAGEWRFFRLRPANFPTARLAALSILLPRLFGNGRIERVLDIVASPGIPPDEHHRKLEQLLVVSGHDSGHCAAIGRARANDIIVNTLIPAGLLRARRVRRPADEQSIQLLYRTFPPLQQNWILSLLQRDLGGTCAPATALLQQGGVELYRFHCRSGRCRDCPLRPAGQG